MITPREIDCPKCGKPNEYSLGSCRRCGLGREAFDKIERQQDIEIAAKKLEVKTRAKPDFLGYLISTA